MWAIFVPLLQWLVSAVVVKAVVATAIFGLVALLVPKAIDLITPWMGTNVSQAFSGIPSSVLWFMSAFNIGTGIPMLISAWVTRFLIRRLPVIG